MFDLEDKKVFLGLIFKPLPHTQLSIDHPYTRIDEIAQQWEDREKELEKYSKDNPTKEVHQILVDKGILTRDDLYYITFNNIAEMV